MKELLFLILVVMLTSCHFSNEPETIPYTKNENEWYTKVNKLYPYKVTLYKADMFQGYADIQDSSFTIRIEYDTLNSKYDYQKLKSFDFMEILRSYSKIRDYKSDVMYLEVDIRNNPAKKTEVYKYDIKRDTLIFRYKR